MSKSKGNTDLLRFKLKMKHIFPRIVLILVGTVLFTLLFRWIFTINSNIFPFREEIYHFWIPIVIPWIPIFSFLWKRSKIIEFRRGGDAQLLLLMLIWLIMTAVSITANEYLKTATGKLVKVGSVDELEGVEANYVSFDKLDVNRDFGSAYSTSSVSGRGSTKYHLEIFFTYLIHSENQENLHTYWYAKDYRESMSNGLSDLEKEVAFQRFFAYSQEHILSVNFPPAHYYEILSDCDDRDYYLKSIQKNESFDVKSPVILVPMEGKFKDRNGDSLFWSFFFFGLGLIIITFVIGLSSFDKVEYNEQIRKRNR